MIRFEGATVIVTGAASGIGFEAAQRVACEGANGVALDRLTDTPSGSVAGLPEDRTLRRGGPRSVRGTGPPHQHRRRRCDRRYRPHRWRGVRGGYECPGFRLFLSAGRRDAAFARIPNVDCDDLVRIYTNGRLGPACAHSFEWVVSSMVRATALNAGRHGVRVDAVNPSIPDTILSMAAQTKGQMAAVLERFAIMAIGKPDDAVAAIT